MINLFSFSSSPTALSFFDHVNMLYGTVSEFCSMSGCPEMNGPGNRQYLWVDDRGKRSKLPATQYIDYALTHIQKTVKDENIFPTKFGQSSFLLLPRLSLTNTLLLLILSITFFSINRQRVSLFIRRPRPEDHSTSLRSPGPHLSWSLPRDCPPEPSFSPQLPFLASGAL